MSEEKVRELFGRVKGLEEKVVELQRQHYQQLEELRNLREVLERYYSTKA